MCGNILNGAHGADIATCDLAAELRPEATPKASQTVLLVEEKPICRAAMGDLVTGLGHFAPPMFAASLAEALEIVVRTPPQIALVDLFTIGFDFEGLRRLTSGGRSAVIAVDDRPNPTFARMARQAGVQGYASKSCDMDQFRAVVRAVLDGGEHFPRGLREGRAQREGADATGLSPRQLEVLKCIAVGMSNQEIGRSLGITPGTVKLHIHAILRATGSRNRTELALIAGRFLAPMVEA